MWSDNRRRGISLILDGKKMKATVQVKEIMSDQFDTIIDTTQTKRNENKCERLTQFFDWRFLFFFSSMSNGHKCDNYIRKKRNEETTIDNLLLNIVICNVKRRFVRCSNSSNDQCQVKENAHTPSNLSCSCFAISPKIMMIRAQPRRKFISLIDHRWRKQQPEHDWSLIIYYFNIFAFFFVLMSVMDYAIDLTRKHSK